MSNVQGYGASQRCSLLLNSVKHSLCGPLGGATFQDYNCYKHRSETESSFLCSNRRDLANLLFKKPLNTIYVKKKTTEFNFNTQLLGFNETSFQCTEDLSIAYKDFEKEVVKDQRKKCLLKNGESITLMNILVQIFYQYSFKEFSTLQTL